MSVRTGSDLGQRQRWACPGERKGCRWPGWRGLSILLRAGEACRLWPQLPLSLYPKDPLHLPSRGGPESALSHFEDESTNTGNPTAHGRELGLRTESKRWDQLSVVENGRD